MSLLQKRPGEILLASFLAAGIAITAGVAVAEKLSGLAGKTPGEGFESGFVDMNFKGASWHVTPEGEGE